MRITREILLKIVRDTTSQRANADRSLISIYMCGSLLENDFMLGGTTDIDLVFIHADLTGAEREIVQLTDEVHLDIAHHSHKEYRHTRQLRLNPWFGPTVSRCQILYDPQHFMNFTQASVRGQFDRSDFIWERARKLAEPARQIWIDFHSQDLEPGPEVVSGYLRAVELAANAVASLSGPPLTVRRFLLNFPQRAEAVGQPGLYPGLLGLLGAPNVDVDTLRNWLLDWQLAYDALPSDEALPELHPARQIYYRSAFEAILRSQQPLAALLPLLGTWTHAVRKLPEDASARAAWQAAFGRLGLLEGEFATRLVALDAYLDLIEETLEKWAQENGVASFI